MKNPMLLSNDPYDLKSLDYYENDWFISIKRDGVRFEVTNKGIKGRSFKEFKNTIRLNSYFKNFINSIPDGIILEGEFYKHGLTINQITPYTNSKNEPIPAGFKIYIFGIYNPTLNFSERLDKLNRLYYDVLSFNHTKFEQNKTIELVEQFRVHSYEEVMTYYNAFLQNGFEGAVLMNGQGRYKEGRLTVRQQLGYKLKPKREDDLLILGTLERMKNLNKSLINELGKSYKRNTVDAKEGTGIAATFICKVRELKPGDKLGEWEKKFGVLTTKVTITGDEESRRNIWDNQEKYIGDYAVVESMDYGVKDKPRHGTLLRIKNMSEK